MKTQPTQTRVFRLILIFSGGIAVATSLSGCQNYLAFGTATKFGLDISQKPDQTVDLTLGYRREEIASIPVAPNGPANTNARPTEAKGANLKGTGTNTESSTPTSNRITDANEAEDAYAVLGRFSVTYDPILIGNGDGLHLKQFFATGMAARKAAGNSNMRKAFGKAAYEVKEKPSTTTKKQETTP
jgi:hypothetical protein